MSMASRTFSSKQALEKELKELYLKFTIGAATAATATLDLTVDIVLTSVSALEARNGTTFTIQVAPAAANPTNTILAVFTGTSSAITVTITPNNGTNNGAVAVNLTTAQLAELINNGTVAGKSVTLTDGSSLRALQTATGGGAQNLADGGEGDGVVGTFSGATVANPALATSSSVGFSSVVRTGIGLFTVNMQDAYYHLRNAQAIALVSSATDLTFQLSADNIRTTKSVGLKILAGATPVDPASGVVVLLKLELKNSST